MADFNRAMNILKKAEFNDCSNILHKNKGEDGYTFMGIYQKAHPNSKIWQELEKYKEIATDIKELSKLMCNNAIALQEAYNIYRINYWNRAKLYDVKSQKIANEIFLFGVNAGCERAIKKAQEIVGVKADGIVGPKTLAALNSFDEDLFDVMFDVEEVKYYKELIAKNPERFKRFEKGWVNRAKAV